MKIFEGMRLYFSLLKVKLICPKKTQSFKRMFKNKSINATAHSETERKKTNRNVKKFTGLEIATWCRVKVPLRSSRLISSSFFSSSFRESRTASTNSRHNFPKEEPAFQKHFHFLIIVLIRQFSNFVLII